MSIIYICILNIKTRALCTKPRVPFPIHTIYWKCAAHQMASTQLNFRTRFWALLKTGKRCLRLSHVQKLILDTFYFLSVPFFDKIASKETSMPHFLVNILFRDKMHRYKKYTKKKFSQIHRNDMDLTIPEYFNAEVSQARARFERWTVKKLFERVIKWI